LWGAGFVETKKIREEGKAKGKNPEFFSEKAESLGWRRLKAQQNP